MIHELPRGICRFRFKEWTVKVNQQKHSLLISPKYDVLSLCKILVQEVNNQTAFELPSKINSLKDLCRAKGRIKISTCSSSLAPALY